MDVRAAPMMSTLPLRISSTIVSGLVNRPTTTIGLAVCGRTRSIHCHWKFS